MEAIKMCQVLGALFSEAAEKLYMVCKKEKELRMTLRSVI